MTYDQFKIWVEMQGYTVRQLRCDDTPPDAAMNELMQKIGLKKYEQYVTRYVKENK